MAQNPNQSDPQSAARESVELHRIYAAREEDDGSGQITSLNDQPFLCELRIVGSARVESHSGVDEVCRGVESSGGFGV